jgi:hypothetical protein
MATIAQIKLAFGQAIAAISGLPVLAHENRTLEPSRPFVLVDFVPTGRINATVDASEIRAQGYIVASVCIAQGGFTTQADTWAQAIIAAFPPARRLGGVCVTEASDLQGYFDGVGWRQPVRIDYRSEA